MLHPRAAWFSPSGAMAMQLDANADTSAEEESFGPQLVSRLEVGVQSALEPLPNKSAGPFPTAQVVSENCVAKFLGFVKRTQNKTKPPPCSQFCFVLRYCAVYLFLTCVGYLQRLLNQIMVSSAFLYHPYS